MKKSALTQQIEKKLISLVPKNRRTPFSSDYFLGKDNVIKKDLKFINLSMPKLRDYLSELLKTEFPANTDAGFKSVEKIYFETDLFAGKTLAISWLEHQTDEFLLKHLNALLTWVDPIDNWAHSDGYCSILAKLFEADQKKLLPTYTKWNKHADPWRRRCSMVGLFYYSRGRQKQPSLALAKKFLNPHLKAPEYYVQKAVGWTIREMYNVYPQETINYLDQNLKDITSIAWVASSEKLIPALKQKLLKKRKALRK